MMKAICSHAAIILSLFYAVLFVIDKINSAMMFIENDITKAILLLLAVVSIANAVMQILDERKRRRLAAAKKARRAAKVSR